MMKKQSKRERTIDILRKNNFNCFPVPSNTKKADSRYDASRTKQNQTIEDIENYGYVPSRNNCVIDFDHEKYNEVLDKIAKEYMVTKTAHNGRHLPVINLKDNASKIELFDYSIQDKKIIEIQGTDHYVIGSGSKIIEDGKELTYQNIGTDVIFDANGQDFDSFAHYICEKFKVEGKKKTRNQHYEMRERFKNKQPPTEGTSNSYFYNASLQCNTDGLTKGQAIELIAEVYDKWTPNYQKRAWSDIENTINNVYERDEKITLGRKEGSDTGIDRTKIALDIVDSRQLYSDIELEIIHENSEGFLEPINGKLRKQLQQQYHNMSLSDFNEIKSKILGLVPDIPERNKDLIVFRNGIRSISKNDYVKSNDIAYTGFKDYDYIENANPKRFKKIMFDNVPKNEHGRLKAGLASVLKPYLDPKMSVIHGNSGVGKSTGLSIIAKLLGQYSMVSEIHQVMFDKDTKAHLKDKLFLVIQELPQKWKSLNILKIMLGEQKFSGRKNFGHHDEWDNVIKVFSSANYLPDIPEEEQNSMHSRRLSLIHNTRQEAYAEDPTLEESIIKEEGSAILSYLVNLMHEDNEYESKTINQEEWEKLSNPEDAIIKKNYDYSLDAQDISIFTLMRVFKQKYNLTLSKTRLTEAFEKAGYNVYASSVKNMIEKIPKQTKI